VARPRRASRSAYDLCHMVTAVFAGCMLSDQGELARALPSFLARDCCSSMTFGTRATCPEPGAGSREGCRVVEPIVGVAWGIHKPDTSRSASVRTQRNHSLRRQITGQLLTRLTIFLYARKRCAGFGSPSGICSVFRQVKLHSRNNSSSIESCADALGLNQAGTPA